MYANFSRLLGLISVKESNTHIIINGIPGLRFSKDVYNHWKTSRINNNIFTSISRSSVKFPKFFAIEVLYILEQLMESRRTYTGRRTLNQVSELLISNTWLKNIQAREGSFSSRMDYKQLDKLLVNPLAHQTNWLKEYDQTTHRYALSGMLMDAAPGSGKTFTQFMTALCLKADTTVIVSPKNAINDVWVKTLRTGFKTIPDFWHSLSGEEPKPGLPYYVVHYDYLEKFLAFAKANSGTFGQVYLGIDESHNFNEQSNRTSHLVELAQVLNARDVIHASGTPFKAMGSEAITLLRTICKDFTPEVEQAFRKVFGKEAKRALEILANRIGLVSFKVTKEEVETPGVDFHEVKVQMKNANDYTLTNVRDKMTRFITERKAYYAKGMKEYEQLYGECLNLHAKAISNSSPAMVQFAEYKKAVATIRKGYDPVTMKDLVMFCNRYELKTIIPSLPERYRKPFLNVRAIIKYVDLKVMGEALSQVLGRLRIDCHLDMLPHMGLDTIVDNATTKTVIFTSYIEVVKELNDQLTKAGYKPLMVYGETNKDLPNIVKQFEKDQDINPLIATFKSLSTAVPLTMANNVVFTNAPWRDFERTQAIARVDRIGQKHRCHVWETYLDTGTEPNISTRSKDIMAWSKSTVEQILGVKSPDDLEASLESLVDNPAATITDGEVFMDKLRQQLPVDIVEGDPSMEAFGGLFKGPSLPTLTQSDLDGSDQKLREFLKGLEKTALNSSWLRNQTFIQGRVPAKDIALEFTLDGKPVTDVLGNIEKARARVQALTDQWGRILSDTDAKVQAIDRATREALSRKNDDKVFVSFVKDQVKQLTDIASPVDKFPGMKGTSLKNRSARVLAGYITDQTLPNAVDNTVPALSKDEVLKAARLVKELLTDPEWSPKVKDLKWIDALDGNPLAKWLFEYDEALHWQYYDRFSRRHGEPSKWTAVFKRLIEPKTLAVALVKLINRSIE